MHEQLRLTPLRLAPKAALLRSPSLSLPLTGGGKGRGGEGGGLGGGSDCRGGEAGGEGERALPMDLERDMGVGMSRGSGGGSGGFWWRLRGEGGGVPEQNSSITELNATLEVKEATEADLMRLGGGMVGEGGPEGGGGTKAEESSNKGGQRWAGREGEEGAEREGKLGVEDEPSEGVVGGRLSSGRPSGASRPNKARLMLRCGEKMLSTGLCRARNWTP